MATLDPEPGLSEQLKMFTTEVMSKWGISGVTNAKDVADLFALANKIAELKSQFAVLKNQSELESCEALLQTVRNRLVGEQFFALAKSDSTFAERLFADAKKNGVALLLTSKQVMEIIAPHENKEVLLKLVADYNTSLRNLTESSIQYQQASQEASEKKMPWYKKLWTKMWNSAKSNSDYRLKLMFWGGVLVVGGVVVAGGLAAIGGGIAVVTLGAGTPVSILTGVGALFATSAALAGASMIAVGVAGAVVGGGVAVGAGGVIAKQEKRRLRRAGHGKRNVDLDAPNYKNQYENEIYEVPDVGRPIVRPYFAAAPESATTTNASRSTSASIRSSQSLSPSEVKVAEA